MSDLNVVVCLAFDHRAPVEGLKAFKQCLRSCAYVDTVLDVSGTFDMIVEGKVESLEKYTEEMARIAPLLQQFVTRLEVNFVGKRTECSEVQHVLWLPCSGGRRRVETHMINKIVAEGDYMRVHLAEWNCLIHETIRNLLSQLPANQFIPIHRSVVVRVDFIDRLLHEGNSWIARLRDGERYKIAKARVKPTLRLMSVESSTPKSPSPKEATVNEGTVDMIEIRPNMLV